MMMLSKQEEVKNLLNPHGVSAFCLFSYFLQLSIFHFFSYDCVITLIHLDIQLSSRTEFMLNFFFSFPCLASIISFLLPFLFVICSTTLFFLLLSCCMSLFNCMMLAFFQHLYLLCLPLYLCFQSSLSSTFSLPQRPFPY